MMDVLLAISENAIHELIWTDALLNEWEEVIVREYQRSAESAASVTTAIREFFADSKVERADYEHLLAEMPGDDPDDHEHMAAAIAGRASILLTRNPKDFPRAPLAAQGVRVMDPDAYLCELVEELPDEVADTILRLAAEKRRPPKTAEDLLRNLEGAGVNRFAEEVRAVLARRSR